MLSKSDFAKLSRTLSGPAGIALVQVSSSRETGAAVGSLKTGVAWSTAKVPVVMAALAEADTAEKRSLARRAITNSDNAAVLELWQGLGSATVARAKTQREVRAAGDQHTVVEGRVRRAGFSAFGQTEWSLADQATFAAHLPCTKDAAPVRSLMRQISAGQSWGLGQIPDVAFKGGWGPDAGGSGYLVRQVGILQANDGSTWGVAIGVHSSAGFSAGTRDLSAISIWLSGRLRRAGVSLTTADPTC